MKEGRMANDMIELPVSQHVEREMTTQELMAQSIRIHEVLTKVMVKDIHYGVIPGTQKPTLYQAGAEKICSTFRLAPRYDVDDLSDPQENFYRYRAKCSLHTIRDGLFVGSAMGEASSAEEKYQWEAAVCQEQYDATDPSRKRIKFKKVREGGHEEILQVQRNCADLANTVLKIACKRAFLSAVKGATAASDILDVDLDEETVRDLKQAEAKEPQKLKPKPKQAPIMPFGHSKGKRIDDAEVPVQDLAYMLKYVSDNIGSEKRARYEKQDREFIKALQEELDKRSATPPETGSETIPDDVWADLCQLWEQTKTDQFVALQEELGVKNALRLAPEYRVSFRDRMVTK